MYMHTSDTADKFYYLPCRLFELCTGALVYHFSDIRQVKCTSKRGFFVSIAYSGIISLLFINTSFISDSLRLLITVFTTSLLLHILASYETANNKIFSNRILAMIGMGSFSIYAWHQVIFAFTRYSFTSELTDTRTALTILCIVAILSSLSYKYIENIKFNKFSWVCISILFVSTTATSLHLYNRAGVIKDVPELEIVAGEAKRGMWAEYCDRGHQYDKDFTSEDKAHWFVIGNSFGRDMVNIILESEVANKVEISYTDDVELTTDHTARFNKADIVFLSTLGVNKELIEKIRKMCVKDCRFYIIGEKNFGECNGQVYRKRFSKDYSKATTHMEKGHTEKNNFLKETYPGIYVDMIGPASTSDGRIKVFSDDGRFISQDCRHLTKAGARYYAKSINWQEFLP